MPRLITLHFAKAMPPDLFELSPIKAIELAAAKIPGSISLAQGIPSFSTPAIIRDFVSEKIRQGLCDKYSLTTGLAELREEISMSLEKEGLAYDPDDEVIVTAGSIEGITASMVAVTSPGDEVLLPSPTYASYLGAIRIARCTPAYVELDEDHNFDFEVERIEKAISRKTRVLLYCSPNNPTGTLFSEEKTRAMIEIAARHNLTIIIDEVYKDFYYTDDRHFTPVSIPEARDRIIRVCSFSKAYAMTGWRVGFLHADRSFTARILKYHDAMVTCAPVASQYAAIAALRHGEPYLRSFRDEFRARRDYVIKRLDELSHVLDYQLPRATYFVFPRIKDTVPLARDSRRLAYDILEKAAVAVVPGSAFGPSGESHLRITFGRTAEDLKTGMDRLAEYFCASRAALSSRPRERFAQQPSAERPEGSLRRKLAAVLLARCARVYLWRNRPTVIGLAGTLGKTVLKRTLLEMLEGAGCKARATILSYNTAIGLPLSILQLDIPRTRMEKFLFPLRMLRQALSARDDIGLLILEYGINSREDAAELASIAIPDWLLVGEISSGDPAVDCEAVQSGIAGLAAQLGSSRVLWCAEDEWVNQLLPDLKAEFAVRSTALENGALSTPRAAYRVSREIVGRSAKLAVIAAALLGEQLALSHEHIQEFLNGGRNKKTL